MALINFKHQIEIEANQKRIIEIRKRIINYLKINDHLYGAVQFDAKSISFDNATLMRRTLPFFGLRSYEIVLSSNGEKAQIKGIFFPGGLLVTGIMLIVALLINLFFGLILIPAFGLIFIANCRIGQHEVKDLIQMGIENNNNQGFEISEEQRKWIENESTCSACGHELKLKSHNCLNCGIRLE